VKFNPRLVEFLFLLKVSRPGFWSTSAWFYLIPVGREWVFDSWPFWLGLVYVTFPLGFILYGWNDITDRATDVANPRKDTFLFGARGTQDQLARLPVRIALVQIPFLAIFAWLEGTRMIAWFAAMLLVNELYNGRRIAFKAHPPLDLLNQAGYLLVFVLSSWLNDVPQLPWPTFVFGALFAMHSHLLGQIMDIEPDRAAGRRTTATIIGVVPSKGLIAAFLLAEAWLGFHFFGDRVIAGFLGASALVFCLDACFLMRSRAYRLGQMRFFLLAWNVIAIASACWVWSHGSLKVMP
jgi:4-hydroxybenzoate polyprenyltransferase